MPVCERLFGIQPGKQAYAWTKLNKVSSGEEPCLIKGHTAGPLTIWLDGKQVLELAEEGSFQVEVPLSYGQHDLVDPQYLWK